MKIKIRNNLIGEGKQIEFLPSLDFFWYNKSYAICVGWLFICFEFWWGRTEDLI